MHQKISDPICSGKNFSPPSSSSLSSSSSQQQQQQNPTATIPSQKNETHISVQNQYNRIRSLQNRILKLQSSKDTKQSGNLCDDHKEVLIGGGGGGVDDGERKKEMEMGMVERVMIDHKIPILDMQILQVQIGIIGRLEEWLGEDGDEGVHKDNETMDAEEEKKKMEHEIEKELRDVVEKWRAIFDGGYDNEEGDEDEMEGIKRNIRIRLNLVVERWLGSWDVEEMSVPGGGSVVIEVVLG